MFRFLSIEQNLAVADIIRDWTNRSLLSRDQSSNCTNLLWTEPNRTTHWIVAFVLG